MGSIDKLKSRERCIWHRIRARCRHAYHIRASAETILFGRGRFRPHRQLFAKASRLWYISPPPV